MKPLAILFATSEMAPWVKTGGLGDVAAALPAALRRAGHDIRVLMPYYQHWRPPFPRQRSSPRFHNWHRNCLLPACAWQLSISFPCC